MRLACITALVRSAPPRHNVRSPSLISVTPPLSLSQPSSANPRRNKAHVFSTALIMMAREKEKKKTISPRIQLMPFFMELLGAVVKKYRGAFSRLEISPRSGICRPKFDGRNSNETFIKIKFTRNFVQVNGRKLKEQWNFIAYIG